MEMAICEPGETAVNCPYDCANSSFNCGNTIGSFFSSPTWPVSSSTAQTNGWCYTLTPPYPAQICFEYRVPNVGDSASVSFSINACGGSTVNQANFPPMGGCNNAGYSSGTISGVSTYDNNCNLVSNAITTGGPGCYNPGDIVTVCLDINPATTCPQIIICPVIDCGATNCSTSPTPIGCPPFNFNDSTYITPCDSNSGYAVVTPDCGDHFTYLWDDPLAQTDSFATGLTPGIYNVLITNTAFNCDTTITVIVPPTSDSSDASINPTNPVCENASAFNLTAADAGGVWMGNGITDTINGTFDPTIAGTGNHTITYMINGLCGDTATTNIIVTPVLTTMLSATICQGDSILLGGVYQTNNGVYHDTLLSSLNCDSILQTSLTVIPIANSSLMDSICQGDSIFLAGSFQNTAGIYYDSLQTSSGCDSIIATTLAVNNLPTITTNADTTICNGITTNINASGGVSYSWDNGLGVGQNHNVTPSSTTTYAVTGTNSSGCSDTSSLTVFVTPLTIANAGNDQELCDNISSFTLTGNSPVNIGETGLWTTSSIANITAINQPITSGTGLANGLNIFIWTISSGTCPANSDTLIIYVENCDPSVLIVPNVFTPNGDGMNDIFTIESSNILSLNCVIYNRWGQELFNWNGIQGFWDGRTTSGVEVPDGTYFFLLNAIGEDGEEHFKKGSFSLIR